MNTTFVNFTAELVGLISDTGNDQRMLGKGTKTVIFYTLTNL